MGSAEPQVLAEPALPPVQVHFEEESCSRHLITFHMCVQWETDLHKDK